MRQILLIILIVLFSNLVLGQNYVFDSGGKMQQSQLYIDTVFKTKIQLQNKLFFERLDSTSVGALKIGSYLLGKLRYVLLDSLDYFILENLTNKPIKIKKIKNQLVAEEVSRYENFGLKPISYFIYPNVHAKLNVEELTLIPFEVLIIKNISKNKKGNLSLKNIQDCRMQLLTSKGILLSTKYIKATGNADHYIDSKFEGQFNSNRNLLAFPE